MDYLNRTFVPPVDPEGSERRAVLDGQSVIIYKPKGKISGLTFLVTAANLPLSKYASIVAALNSADHVVVGLYINVLNPLNIRNLHRMKAECIPSIFDELKDEFKVRQYDIIGHSIGGKIALLTAALYDDQNLIRNILALDPVDQTPVEFTNESALKQNLSDSSNEKGRSNLSLGQSKADIVITCTDSGYFVSKNHNGREIQKKNPSVKLIMHRNSCHMVYTDDGGTISWKALMGSGTSSDRKQVVKEQTLQLIKDRANASIGSGVNKSVLGIKGKVAKSLNDGVSDLKELGNDAEKKVNKLKGAAMFSKFMG
eukprot:CCRYP_002886-RA/>CCRYP_002886-RA protein AED:0.00 eAED:0.00 QI:146/1/1/1/1/1/2/2251/312